MKPLLYKPPPRWQVWAALGSAVLIHAGAVGYAAIKHEPPPIDLSNIPTATVEATLEPQEEQPTPPPEDIPVPEPPPMPEVKPEFVEETTPPPRMPHPMKAAPIRAPGRGTASISSAKVSAMYAPRPPYPYEARAHHITGSGVCVLSVDVASGNVTEAVMAKSIGSPILDDATVSAFKRWRFRPNSVPPRVKVPITFTMTGASY
jgi:periplasmic protein TonB